MKNAVFSLIIAFSGLLFSASATALTLYTGGNYYRYEDRYDTLWNNGTDLFYNVGIALDDVAGSGVSFHSDVLYANEYYDAVTKASYRSPLQITTGYLDWRSRSGKAELRLGRQPCANLATEHFDIDGIAAEIRPTGKCAVNVVAGAAVPPPYTRYIRSQVADYYDTIIDADEVKRVRDEPKDTLLAKNYLLSKFPDQAVLSIDGSVSMIPFTTITAALAMVPKAFDRAWVTRDTVRSVGGAGILPDTVIADTLYEKGDVRVALGTVIRPVDQLRFNGSLRWSMVNKGFDRYDGRMTIVPNETIELCGYLIGERGRIDSANYFSVMFNAPLTEAGLMLNAFSEGGDGVLQADYHFTAVHGDGVDHYLSLNLENRYVDGGIVLSAGRHGSLIRPYGGFRLPFLRYFSLIGSGEYAHVNRSVTKRVYHFAVLTGGLKMAFNPIGLTLYPRVEYCTNRYYTNDVRFLLTAGLLFTRFWEPKS